MAKKKTSLVKKEVVSVEFGVAKKSVGFDLVLQQQGGVMTTLPMGVTLESQAANWIQLRNLALKATDSLHKAQQQLILKRWKKSLKYYK